MKKEANREDRSEGDVKENLWGKFWKLNEIKGNIEKPVWERRNVIYSFKTKGEE